MQLSAAVQRKTAKDQWHVLCGQQTHVLWTVTSCSNPWADANEVSAAEELRHTTLSLLEAKGLMNWLFNWTRQWRENTGGLNTDNTSVPLIVPVSVSVTCPMPISG